jgi:DNA mismatch endonuclease (patch repair protein)
MPDRLTPAERSDHMRRIRKRDTSPEMIVRRIAHSLGYRFRLHRPDLPGTPDLVFPRLHKAILVYGCFWHQHSGCSLARQPKSRLDYWLPKLQRNVARDLDSRQKMELLGWQCMVVWECQTGDRQKLKRRLEQFLHRAD